MTTVIAKLWQATICTAFKFTGTLDKLTLTINRPQLTPADVKQLTEAGRNNRASE